MKQSIRSAADTVLGVWGDFQASRYDIRKTIVIACTGRGGSTWLAEIIATLPGYHMLWEPLHLGNNPECTKYGFGWQNYIPRGTTAPVKRDYIEKILTGEKLSTQITTSLHFHPLRLLRLRGYVAKFVNANMMLGWMLEEFPVRGILMIRHPCAVVSSQLMHGGWDHVTKENCTIPEGLFVDYPHLADVFDDIHEKEEVLAFGWALQTYVPLRQSEPHPWLLTTYERLVERGEHEVERIFHYLDESPPRRAREKLRERSATASRTFSTDRRKNLSKWRKRLTKKQVDNILRVTHEVGVEAYTVDLVPDYSSLPLGRDVFEDTKTD